MPDQDIIFTEHPGASGHIGEILLNRPSTLNALTLKMCQSILNHLSQWALDDKIKAVIIKGAGDRAFCAGGDIRQLYDNKDHLNDHSVDFFWHEYHMNAALHHFPKPYIAFLNGICMGGGAGISIHGSHRVATENLKFAMPETMIGFFPDIGASHLLTRAPDYTGWYLGLTGNMINAIEAKQTGIITNIIESKKINSLETALLETNFLADEHHKVSAIIQEFHQTPQALTSQLNTEKIAYHFQQDSIEAIIHSLKQQADDWSQKTLSTLLSRSPTSLKVTFEQFSRAEKSDFDKIMETDFNIAQQFLHTPDFFEGIRAALIDKDRNPHWQPDTLDTVNQKEIDNFFTDKSSKTERLIIPRNDNDH